MRGRWITGLLVAAFGLHGESLPERPALLDHVPLLTRVMQFVEWPGAMVKRGKVTVGLVGFGREAGVIRQVAERGLDLRTVTSAEQMRECDVLLFGRQTGPRVGGILRLLVGEAVLTVGAIPGFAQMGGMVELPDLAVGRRLTVNLVTARRSGFRIHPGLMGVADFLRRE